MIQNITVTFVLYLVFFLLFWNILDLIYSALIAHYAYQFAAGTDLFLPTVVAVLTGALLFLRGKD